MEIFIAFLATSGVLGLVANYLVSLAKAVASWGQKSLFGLDPRVWNAIISLLLAIVTVIAGGEANPSDIATYLSIIVMAVLAWVTAHFTHKVNSV